MLNKKTAIVTGCNGSLGTFFCKKLIEKNYSVIGLDLQKKSLQKNIIYKKLDISNFDQVKLFFKSLNKIDLLINNAGTGVYTPSEKRTKIEIKKVVDTNLLGNLYISLETLKKMKKLKRGKIINIASIYGFLSPDFDIYSKGDRFSSEVYGASKSSVIQLTRYFAVLLAKKKININCLSPGGILNKKKQSLKFIKRYTKNVPCKRMANVQDIFSGVLYLTSETSNYTTGQNIIIDGGLSLK